MVDYRKLKVGDKVEFSTHEFDGDFSSCGVVTSVSSDHAIMKDNDGDILWIDDDTAFQFTRR